MIFWSLRKHKFREKIIHEVFEDARRDLEVSRNCFERMLNEQEKKTERIWKAYKSLKQDYEELKQELDEGNE